MFKEEVFIEAEPEIEHEDYVTQRNKPMPNRIHGTIQLNLGTQLVIHFGDQFDFSSEVTLDTTPASTPDIVIFTKKEQALDWKTTRAKEKEVPLTTIEIMSPSQTFDEMAKKIWEIYFPLGVKSSWIVLPPPFKAIYVLTPDEKKHFFDAGTMTDPATGIHLDLDKVFQGVK